MASDIVYAASFQRPAQAILTQENVTDAAIVDSVWGLSPELANPDPNSNGLWIQSVRDAGSVKPCTGGSIGTSIDGVTANGKALVAGDRHDGETGDPALVQGHGRQPRQLPGARYLDPPHRGWLEDAGDPGQVAPAQ
jgi:hypothetical protein